MPAPQAVAHAVPPRRKIERKRACGWPVPRAAMRDPVCVVDRLAEDLGALIDARGADCVVTDEDYRRLGWSRAQIAAHALDAARRLPRQRACDFEAEAA